jgi:hypothetical protein
MKHSPILLLIICILFFANCKKKDTRNYSYWQVNQDKFSSNNVSVDIGKAISTVGINEIINSFHITFHFSTLPISGNFPLAGRYSHAHPDSVTLNFYYKENFYVPQKSGLLIVNEKSGKSSFFLNSTCFENYNDAKDTVLITGTFNEP